MHPKTLILICCILLSDNLLSQKPSNYADIPVAPVNYILPTSQNGLAEVYFMMKGTVKIDRWDKSADVWIRFDYKAGTAETLDPAFKFMYILDGKYYGDQHVGKELFNGIRVDRDFTEFEVVVSAKGQSRTMKLPRGEWMFFKVNDPQIDAKSVSVNFIRATSVRFTGIRPIENHIRAMIRNEKQKAAESSKIEADKEAKKKAETERARTENSGNNNSKQNDATASKNSSAKTGTNASSNKSTSASGTTSKSSSASSSSGVKGKETTNTKSAEGSKSTNSSNGVNPTVKNMNNAEEAKRLANQRAAEEARAEQEMLRKKQAEYDKWKTEANRQQAVNDATQAGMVGILLFTLGQWIYNDKMGKADPTYCFIRSKNEAQFGVGIDYGYSFSSYPLLFASNVSSMSGGVSTNKKEVIAKNPFVINFEPTLKMGAENNKYGGFGYATVKLGISPIFDASNLSFQFGGRIYGGINWAKFYIDYGRGSRKFTKSIKDVEENGSGKSKTSISKFEYGVRFTVSPKDDLRRSHLYFGIISEKNKQDKNNGVVDPKTGTLSFTSLIPKNSGFSIQWNKEHTFKVYTNIYPKFAFAGEVDASSGELASSFKTTPAGTFIEFGFVRAVNWWIN